MRVVEVEDLWWKYASGSDWVLRGVDLEVEEGELLGILGPSGAGKTTLCLALMGIIPNSIKGEMRGSVRIFGMDTKSSQTSEIAEYAGIVFQDPDTQFVTMRVVDEVAFPLENFGVGRDEILRRVEEALRATRMWEYRDRYPFELSGGQKQRVAIAAMLARRPRLLILDEPTSDLDPVGKREVFEVLARLREEHGMTLIVVEHRTEELAKYADELLVLREGEVVARGEPREVLAKVDYLEEIGVRPPQVTELAHAVMKIARAPDGNLPMTLEEGISFLEKFKHRLRPRNRARSNSEPGEPIVRLREVSYVYPGGAVALENVSLDVYRGEFLALIGHNGSGKTTMARLMVGLYKPTSGVVEIFGRDSRELRASDVALRIGYVYQNPDHQLFCETVYEEVAFALRSMGLPEEEIDERVGRALSYVGLEGRDGEAPFFLSKGERQRLAIAVVLAMDPEVVVVDEPTTGQDDLQSRRIMQLLEKMNRDGKTIVVITHDMRLVAEYCTRVAVLKGGRLLAAGPTEHVLADAELLGEAGLEPPQIVELSSRLLGEPVLSIREVEVV